MTICIITSVLRINIDINSEKIALKKTYMTYTFYKIQHPNFFFSNGGSTLKFRHV